MLILITYPEERPSRFGKRLGEHTGSRFGLTSPEQHFIDKTDQHSASNLFQKHCAHSNSGLPGRIGRPAFRLSQNLPSSPDSTCIYTLLSLETIIKACHDISKVNDPRSEDEVPAHGSSKGGHPPNRLLSRQNRILLLVFCSVVSVSKVFLDKANQHTARETLVRHCAYLNSAYRPDLALTESVPSRFCLLARIGSVSELVHVYVGPVIPKPLSTQTRLY